MFPVGVGGRNQGSSMENQGAPPAGVTNFIRYPVTAGLLSRRALTFIFKRGLCGHCLVSLAEFCIRWAINGRFCHLLSRLN